MLLVAVGTIQLDIGHEWCIVPLLVAWILAQRGHSWATLNDIAVTSRRTATICTLVLAAVSPVITARGGVCTSGSR